MASSFVPFLPAGTKPPSGSGGRLRVVSSSGTPSGDGAFTPLATTVGGAAPPASQLHVHHAARIEGSRPGNAAPSRPPVLTLHRQGERIVGIRVECSCGEVIELACQY